MSGKLIRLFLTDGQPNGMRTVEISNMTIHGTIFPRNQLDRFIKRDAANKPGVYLLFGQDEHDLETDVLYIGQGDPVLPRLREHARNKEFWTEAMVFSSKDDYLTKTQVKYLEAELYSLAKEAYRVKLDNTQAPTKPNISEVDEAEIRQFLDAIKLLLLALGRDFLEPRVLTEAAAMLPEMVFELRNKGASARMAIIDNKYVILKESTAVRENRRSIPPSLVKLRQDLVLAGILVAAGDGLYRFTQDATFSSPSYAASAIVGGAANGRELWKYNGKALRDLDSELPEGEETED